MDHVYRILQDFRAFLSFQATRVPLLRNQRPTWSQRPSYTRMIHPLYFDNRMIVIPGDNSCLFHCFTKWWLLKKTRYLTVTDETIRELARILRSHMVTMMKKYPNQLTFNGESIRESSEKEEKVSFEEYCDWIKRVDSWGGLPEVEILSILLQVNVVVYQQDPINSLLSCTMVAGLSTSAPTITIFLDGWKKHKSSHFSLLMPTIPNYIETIPINQHQLSTHQIDNDYKLIDLMMKSGCDTVFLFIDQEQDLFQTYDIISSHQNICNVYYIVNDPSRMIQHNPTHELSLPYVIKSKKGQFAITSKYSDTFNVYTWVQFRKANLEFKSSIPMLLFMTSNSPCDIQSTCLAFSGCESDQPQITYVYISKRTRTRLVPSDNTTILRKTNYGEFYQIQ